MTDGQFHNTGFSQRRIAARRGPGNARVFASEEGRKAVTKRDEDARAFKTPSLRDVALRAPYMHDGTLATLDAVVRYYAVECGAVKDDGLDERLKPFDAGKGSGDVEADVRDLVAFLCALTGDTRAGLATSAWSRRAERIRLRLIDKGGILYRGSVALSPAGDAVPAPAPDGATPRHATPDVDGWIEFRPFASTHVRVTFPGTNLHPASGDLVPDTCHEATLTLEPLAARSRIMAGSVIVESTTLGPR